MDAQVVGSVHGAAMYVSHYISKDKVVKGHLERLPIPYEGGTGQGLASVRYVIAHRTSYISCMLKIKHVHLNLYCTFRAKHLSNEGMIKVKIEAGLLR